MEDENREKDEKKQKWTGRKIFRAAAAVLGGAAAVLGAPILLGTLGFGTAGVTGGSFAAWLMSVIATSSGGGVTAGSLFAICQSIGAAGLTGTSATVIGAMGAAISATLAAVFEKMKSWFSKEGDGETKGGFTDFKELFVAIATAAKLMEEENYDEALGALDDATNALYEVKRRVNIDDEKLVLVHAEMTLMGMFATVYEKMGRLEQAKNRRAWVEKLAQEHKQAQESPKSSSTPPLRKEGNPTSPSSSSKPTSNPPMSPSSPSAAVDKTGQQSSAVSGRKRRCAIFSSSSNTGESLVLHRAAREMSVTRKMLAAGVVLGELPKDAINMIKSLSSGGVKLFRIAYRNRESAANVLKGLWNLTKTKDGFLTINISGSDAFKDTAGLEEVLPSVVPLCANVASAIANAAGRA
eukprot:TRINITY_DN6053_c0_g1_i1.p1 TRINITY_DN6053_c0_g1~~TRINITY_DN6053_c0_g1_i1.p1  ORF type:complete len:410 (+),score=68.87 TRINITY_DN6053_c0_g1_i1:201-1430(+)